MSKRTGPTDTNLRKLISSLKKDEKPIAKRIAKDLGRPRRIRREVNLLRIDKFSKEGDSIIVPGKVLGVGEISKKITISALSYSQSAIEKINKSGSKMIPLEEGIKQKGVKIIG